MKRIISLLLVVTMAVLLVGCNPLGSASDIVNGIIDGIADSTDNSGTDTDNDVKETTADEPEDTDTEAPETTEAPEPEKPAEISRGNINGDVYENEFIGFKFTKPESWVYATDEEMAAALNLGVESFYDDKFKESVENNPAVFDMMVSDTLTGTNLNLVYENLKKSMATNITEKQYLDVVRQQFANMTTMTVTFPDEYTTVKLGDVEFTKAVCTTEAYGISMTQIYYIRKVDAYMTTMTVTITNGYSAEDIEAMFE